MTDTWLKLRFGVNLSCEYECTYTYVMHRNVMKHFEAYRIIWACNLYLDVCLGWLMCRIDFTLPKLVKIHFTGVVPSDTTWTAKR